MSGFAGHPVRARLTGERWHFQHGPIDLILTADGEPAVRDEALTHCWHRFQTILEELVAELPLLRRPACPSPLSETPGITGAVASRMSRACGRFAAERFITPMAAVAGAVADELIRSFERPGITRAFINNGGDIALQLTPGQQYQVGVWADLARNPASDPTRCDLDGMFRLYANTPVRGVATSGWRGRSFSLGIADSVTVLAADAATADAAATLIANAVDCDYPGITRAPANQMKDDTDLGNLPVTVQVPRLPPEAVECALHCGRAEAEYWRDRGDVYAAAIFLQGRTEIVAQAAHLSHHREVA
jgi:hypothetical protein